jgi:hypothetical protein
MANNHGRQSGKIRSKEGMTYWFDPRQPNAINVCTGDPAFTNADGAKPGLWMKVRRGESAFGRIARALRDAGELHPQID